MALTEKQRILINDLPPSGKRTLIRIHNIGKGHEDIPDNAEALLIVQALVMLEILGLVHVVQLGNRANATLTDDGREAVNILLN